MSAAAAATEVGAAAIDVRHLTKRYDGRAVVDDFSITVERGLIFGFLGPNGSGKTTTIRMLCGLLVPDAGEGTCLGYDLRREAAKIKRNVGYMTQRFSLYEDLSIEENLEFVARVYDVPRRRATVRDALDRLRLANRRGQLAGTLSGGWKQRLALAACLLHRPQLLLLDEPTAGVDPKARRDFWEHIHALSAEGMTVLVSTHYMDEAERCHRLAYLAYGHLLATGTPEQVIADSRLSTFVQVGLGQWRIDPAMFPTARSYSEIAGQVGSGVELRLSSRVRIAGEVTYTALYHDLHYTSDEVAPRILAFAFAIDGRF